MPTYCERKTEIATEKQAEIEEKEAFFTFDDSQSGNQGRSRSRQQAIWDQWHGPQLNTLVSRANKRYRNHRSSTEEPRERAGESLSIVEKH